MLVRLRDYPNNHLNDYINTIPKYNEKTTCNVVTVRFRRNDG